MKVFEAAVLLSIGTVFITVATIAFILGGFTFSSDSRMLFLQALAVAGVAFLSLSIRNLSKISQALSTVVPA